MRSTAAVGHFRKYMLIMSQCVLLAYESWIIENQTTSCRKTYKNNANCIWRGTSKDLVLRFVIPNKGGVYVLYISDFVFPLFSGKFITFCVALQFGCFDVSGHFRIPWMMSTELYLEHPSLVFFFQLSVASAIYSEPVGHFLSIGNQNSKDAVTRL